MARPPRPPRLARWLLRLRPLESRRAEIEADLEELFVERCRRGPRSLAAIRYAIDVLSVWRWNPSGARIVRDASRDLAYALRIFRRTPGSVAITVFGLALAIGVATTVFSLLNATLFFAGGVPDAVSAVHVERAWKGGTEDLWRYGEYVALKESSTGLRVEATSIENSLLFSTTAPAAADVTVQRVQTRIVSGGYMTTFGARALYGRVLTSGDDTAAAPVVAVLGYTFWQRRFGSDPLVIGRAVWLDGRPVTIVGVVERGFTGLSEVPPALWLTLNAERTLHDGERLSRTSRTPVTLAARLPPGAAPARVEPQVGALAAAIGAASADAYRTIGVRLVPANERALPKGAALIATLVLTGVGLIVLLACVNVANLQLANAVARQREIGVRLALGASRARVVRQLITESLTLAWAAGALGLAFSVWLVGIMASATGVPITYDLAPDGRVYAFLLFVSCAAGIGAGLSPARYGARGDVLTALKGDGGTMGTSGRPGRPRAILMSVQMAASLVLVAMAALAARAAVSAARIDVGFDAQRLVAVSLNLGREEEAKAQLTAALDRLRSLPAVRAASLTDMPPFSFGLLGVRFTRDGRLQRALLSHTSADYFTTVGLRIVRGRSYSEAEVAAGAPVAVVSETLARFLWGSNDPIGQVMSDLGGLDRSTRVTVIGVAADAVLADLSEVQTAAVYRPLIQFNVARLIVRIDGVPEAAVPALRAALQPSSPRRLPDVRIVREKLEAELGFPRTFAVIAVALAAFALMLAVIGIYGVTAFVTNQRTREIGIRLAIGATRRDVLRLLLHDGLRAVLIGLGCGLATALLAALAFQGALYGVTASDPASFAIASIVLGAAALAAVYFPTRRASRLDPAAVLRQS